jgi:hypothetical protein
LPKKKSLLKRLYLTGSIVNFEDFCVKKRFFHSLTFSRYKQFGIKEAKSSDKHKFI